MQSTEENKAILRRFYQELHSGNFDIVDDVYSPDYISHNFDAPDGEKPGTEGVKQAYLVFHTAFGDLEVVEENMIAEADCVVHHLRYRATHRGDFLGMPASGKRIELSGVDIYRFTEGKIIEKWSQRDRLAALLQLGYTVQPA